MHSEYVLPFYVVCDESFSMTDHLAALNDGIRDLHRAVGTDPVVADRTRFCAIGFSGQATVVQPLGRLGEIVELSGSTASSGTCFGAAFTLLRDTIERDMTALGRQFRQVHQPAVFFLSDGQPTDPVTWPAAYRALTDPAWPARPNVIAFGVGDADAVNIGRIGTFRAFMGDDGASPGSAVHEFARALTTSIVRSRGGVAPHVPATVPGFRTLRSERG